MIPLYVKAKGGGRILVDNLPPEVQQKIKRKVADVFQNAIQQQVSIMLERGKVSRPMETAEEVGIC